MDIEVDNVQRYSRTLVDLLRQRAALQPDREAFTYLVDGETDEISLTYGELDRRARAIGAQLQERTVPGDRAVILCPPDLDYVVALYGCLYAGLVAVPFYPPRSDQSHEPLQNILAVAGATVVLNTAAARPTMDSFSDRIPALRGAIWQSVDRTEDGAKSAWREPDVTGDSLAYLLLTSGTSSEPKAVVRSHKAVLDGMAVTCPHAGLMSQSKFVSWIPMHSAFGIHIAALMPLYGGYPAILMAPGAVLERPFRWLQAISRTGATHSAGSNFAYDLVARATPPSIRETLDLSSWECAWNGGEQVRAETLSRFVSMFAPCGFRLEALRPSYGMTEVMMVSGGLARAPAAVKFDVEALAENRVVTVSAEAEGQMRTSCGTPLPGQPVVIVNPITLQPCSPDEIGEIWVTGPSVAQGYWNRPEETEKTFRARLATGEGPFLRTGDLGFLYEGELFLTGRLKELIIIRGRNLYPQDIEQTVEASHPALVPNAGAAFSIDTGGEERLVVVHEAEGVGEDGREVVGAIRRAVAHQHDVQVYAVVLISPGSMPKTGSGKIQRAGCRTAYEEGRLPLLHESVLPERKRPQLIAPFAPARTATEAVLVAIWEAVLEIDGIGIHDDFFELGGDSLLTVQLVSQARQHGIALSSRQLLAHPTIAELAPLAGAAAPVQIEHAIVSGSAPLLPRQYLELEHPLRPEHQIAPILVRLPASADPRTVERAVRAILHHHDALRTRFRRVGDDWQQVIPAEETSEIFTYVDVSQASETDKRTAAWKAFSRHRAFIDPSSGPMTHAIYINRGGERSSLLALLVHHLIIDAASAPIVAEDLLTAYTQIERGDEIRLPRKTTSVLTWARRLAEYTRSPELQGELHYWISSIPARVDPLPTDYSSVDQTPGRDLAAGATLTADETTTLFRRVPQSLSVHAGEILVAALAMAFERWTGSPSLFLTFVGHGRGPLFDDLDVSRTVGVFPARFPMMLHLDGAQTVREVLERVRAQVRAIPNNGIGYGMLRYLNGDTEMAQSLAVLPTPQVVFNYQGQFDASSSAGSGRVGQAEFLMSAAMPQDHPAHDDIMIWARVHDGELSFTFRVHESVYSTQTVHSLADATVDALRSIIAACQATALGTSQVAP
ncbi:MAG TPA: AMP-binding protein [Chloroflexota bacterium]